MKLFLDFNLTRYNCIYRIKDVEMNEKRIQQIYYVSKIC